MIEWISVEKEIPKYHQRVLVKTTNDFYFAELKADFIDGNYWKLFMSGILETHCGFAAYEKVTHWAEINEPEKKDEVV